MIDFIELACATYGQPCDLACKREASLAVTAELASVAAASHAGLSGTHKATPDHGPLR